MKEQETFEKSKRRKKIFSKKIKEYSKDKPLRFGGKVARPRLRLF